MTRRCFIDDRLDELVPNIKPGVEMTQKEVAEAIGCNTDTIKRIERAAREKLQQQARNMQEWLDV